MPPDVPALSAAGPDDVLDLGSLCGSGADTELAAWVTVGSGALFGISAGGPVALVDAEPVKAKGHGYGGGTAIGTVIAREAAAVAASAANCCPSGIGGSFFLLAAGLNAGFRAAWFA